ncbi:MAG TPA: alpha-amylase family glycosyl hydrolase [Chitinophagaceae bacterium]|nr:alpha-amylase family glycosyl hydrolase [Chitinophagaceae bacterium]
MFDPVATYRLQFHSGFTFSHLQQQLPYLSQLGIRTIYASPIFEAVPGSTHGYDGLHPHRINPELGTIDQLRQVLRQVKERGMFWIQDIVPNHMAFHPKNEWLMDVMERGLR